MFFLLCFASYECRLSYAIEQIADFPFCFYKVFSTFCPTSAFSELDFNIEAYVHVDESGSFQLRLKAKDVFKVEAVDPGFTTALKFIMNGTYTSTTEHSEKEVMVSLCSEVFLPLSNEVILENTYKTFLEKTRPVPLRTGHIGMGAQTPGMAPQTQE